MTESHQPEREDLTNTHESNFGNPIELRPNPALGILRFFVWLAPTGIVVLCLFLTEAFNTGFPFQRVIFPSLGVGMFLCCAWYDSILALPCRTGRRKRSTHIIIYVINQTLFVVPALLFAIVYALCGMSSW